MFSYLRFWEGGFTKKPHPKGYGFFCKENLKDLLNLNWLVATSTSEVKDYHKIAS